MSTKRGRKKAAAKPAGPVLPDQEPEVSPAELQATAKPAAPPSPIVTLAKHAITPVVAAAKRAVSVVAAALPAIPEASAVDAGGLDFDKQQHPDSPRSPTGQTNPFSERQTVLLDGFSLQDDDAAPGSDQQQRRQGMHSSGRLQRDELDEELEPLQEEQKQQQASAAAPLGKRLQQHALLLWRNLSAWFGAQRSSRAPPVLALGVLLLAGMLGMLILQGSALRAQQSMISQQQQQVAAQQAALAALQEQLQQAQQQLQRLPDMQQLQDDASSCKAGLDGLGSSQDSLQETLDSLAALAGQLETNVSSLSQASTLGEKAWQLLEAATGSNGAAMTADAAAAAVAAPALLQQTQQQQELAQQLQQSMAVLDTLPATIKSEVQQQLNAALPPVDLALADCGARIAFHTPLNSTALAAAAAGASTAASAAASSGAMQWLQQQVAQRLLPGAVAKARQQQGQLPGAAQINSIILRPQRVLPASTALEGNSAGNSAAAAADVSQGRISCLPLLLAPAGGSAAAVLEIALPQPAAIDSVTFHHTMSSAEQHGSYNAAPGMVHIALANSSSCPAGLCSALGHAALMNINASAADAVDATDAAASGDDAQSVLAQGVVGVQQEVTLLPESFVAGRAVVKIQPAATAAGDGGESSAAGGRAGVVADRLIVHVSSSMGGAEGLCMQRISVQGVPVDPASFC